MAARPFHLAWFLQRSSVQARGEPWTGHIGHTWMVRTCSSTWHGASSGLLRLPADRGYILCRRELRGSTELYLNHGIAVRREDPRWWPR